MLRFQALRAFFFGDEHSVEYRKTFYTIMKANSHIVKPLNFFCCLFNIHMDLFLRLFGYAIILMILLHHSYTNNKKAKKVFWKQYDSKTYNSFFCCFNSSIAMSTQFWLCFSGHLVSSHHLSKLYYKSLFPTTLRFIMLSVNRRFGYCCRSFPWCTEWPFPSSVFTVPENYNTVALIPPKHFLSRNLLFILLDLFSW